ncbi:hypothetical protein CERZMDRAFT_99932 [Cercospora zeae-maydis SCOH1-5]|uniref:Uncharacterized protein n=1 Tax=Cercospora zeae-maydis SCOH1-5 TaxID=717836 RepID=A0A6A6F901_9PEZI|nr:hypothetical protein CERZMDRAFT_99932 [Cercospora zeae-maydis SCOH1-5]
MYLPATHVLARVDTRPSLAPDLKARAERVAPALYPLQAATKTSDQQYLTHTPDFLSPTTATVITMSLSLDTSSPAAVAPSDGVCHFDKLPQELLIMICDLAYGYPAAKCVISKKQWKMEREELAKTGELDSLPPYQHHTDRFLVSKRFFLGAIEAYIKSQHLDTTRRLLFRVSHCITVNVAFQSFARSIKTYSFSAHQLQEFSSLRDVEIVVYDFNCTRETGSTKYPWLHVLQDEDFANLDLVRDLRTLRGLNKFKLNGLHCDYANTETKRQMWEKNISALQSYLMPVVTAPKLQSIRAKPTDDTGMRTLHRGSRVSGIGCKPSLVAGNLAAATYQQTVFDTSMVTRVMSLETDQLSCWLGRVLRQYPELVSLLEDAGSAIVR